MELLGALVIIHVCVSMCVEVASIVSNPDVEALSRKIENWCIVICILHKGTSAGEEPMLHKNDWSFLVEDGPVSNSEKF